MTKTPKEAAKLVELGAIPLSYRHSLSLQAFIVPLVFFHSFFYVIFIQNAYCEILRRENEGRHRLINKAEHPRNLTVPVEWVALCDSLLTPWNTLKYTLWTHCGWVSFINTLEHPQIYSVNTLWLNVLYQHPGTLSSIPSEHTVAECPLSTPWNTLKLPSEHTVAGCPLSLPWNTLKYTLWTHCGRVPFINTLEHPQVYPLNTLWLGVLYQHIGTPSSIPSEHTVAGCPLSTHWNTLKYTLWTHCGWVSFINTLEHPQVYPLNTLWLGTLYYYPGTPSSIPSEHTVAECPLSTHWNTLTYTLWTHCGWVPFIITLEHLQVYPLNTLWMNVLYQHPGTPSSIPSEHTVAGCPLSLPWNTLTYTLWTHWLDVLGGPGPNEIDSFPGLESQEL